MFAKNIFFFFIWSIVLFSFQLSAQEIQDDTVKNPEDKYPDTISVQGASESEWESCISPFVELLGKGFISLNVDFRKKKTYAISIGIQPLEGLSPNVMYYHFYGKRRRFELGGGLSAGFNKDFNLAVILVHGVIGYRYQKKKGIFFRIGITPLYVIFPHDTNKFYPLPGLSLGYCF
jgi:hypothetical protein